MIQVDHIEAARERILAEYAELARSDRRELSELAAAILDGARPRDLMESGVFGDLFQEGFARWENMSDEQREELLATDSTVGEVLGDESPADEDVPPPDDDDDEDFSQRSIMR
ncbi:hypothetical protein BJF85_02025 [Saccharomonospora sp. CUA-673]|uniref:hypothetical protein n=1 Tax=Saccharomonospora sp. CUA-673 TaxID=1904969 RepID=UPI00095F9BBB|nr:hypothetical protein [Saccharomonospora sp. CUA-673]OLT45196.1 hypothetical protein BJF85_02025 [Saccharomonospora sp. CUA-673]